MGGPRTTRDTPKLGYQGGDDRALVLISTVVVSVCVAHERGGEIEDINEGWWYNLTKTKK